MASCGTITYRLINAFDGQELFPPEFQLSTASTSLPHVEVLGTDRQFIDFGPYDLVIEATLGAYATVRSDPLMLTVVNPCDSTVLISQQIPQLFTVVDAPLPVEYQVPKFKDSVSAQYSSIYGDGSEADLCGPQNY